MGRGFSRGERRREKGAGIGVTTNQFDSDDFVWCKISVQSVEISGSKKFRVRSFGKESRKDTKEVNPGLNGIFNAEGAKFAETINLDLCDLRALRVKFRREADLGDLCSLGVKFPWSLHLLRVLSVTFRIPKQGR